MGAGFISLFFLLLFFTVMGRRRIGGGRGVGIRGVNDCIVHLVLRGDASLRLAMFYLACILLLSPLPFETVQLFSGVLGI